MNSNSRAPAFLLACVGIMALLMLVLPNRPKPSAAPTPMHNSCERISEYVHEDCTAQYENRFEFEGGSNYSRGEHLKDITLCERMVDNILHECRHN